MTRALLAAALLAGCNNNDLVFSGTVETPVRVGLLDQDASPFNGPVGYAIELHGGGIRLLDLQHGTYLADDPFASFLPSDRLATGGERLLGAVAPWAPSTEEAWALVLDHRFDQLLRVPHVVGRGSDGHPEEFQPVVLDVAVTATGANVGLAGVSALAGRAATESWTATFDGRAWTLRGSRSGPHAPIPHNTYSWLEAGGIGVSLRGAPVAGDVVSFRVDTGILETDLPGDPIDLRLSPDGSRAALTARSGTDGASEMWWLDPSPDAADGGLTGPIALDDGSGTAAPGALAWSHDNSAVYVATRDTQTLFVVPADGSAVQRHDLPGGAADMVATAHDGGRIWYLTADRAEVRGFDPVAGRPIDLNAATPEVDGHRFFTTLQGLSAHREAYLLPGLGTNGERREGTTVAVSLASGRVIWLEEETGCFVRDDLGPRTEVRTQVSSIADYQSSFDLAPPQTAYLEVVEDSRRHVNVNPCAGVAPTEGWAITWRADLQAWEVEGAVSGKQTRLAYEDERYLSDRGEISFVVRAGSIPSEPGWRFTFNVSDGLRAADGTDPDSRVTRVGVVLPGAPTAYTADDGAARLPHVVVPITGADALLQLDPLTGELTALWD